ncbi:UbiA prenyltransferase [Artomyces pyxidatus]|uniref:UbiA prenyltransferase n=1 Tax=Artomyces pyxidatus TaxID=48021 RepID=A0ACB8ST91_9AGAM|nr:UbiA prenyltransferase [Artomyces pyxidatus]
MSLPIYAFCLMYGFAGVALLHIVGCVWNDIMDRQLDRQMERTRHRPIANGRVSIPGALAFMSAPLALLLALLWPLSELAWWFGLATVFPLAGLYPLMKRVTHWPQVWLGCTLNAVVFIVWAQFQGSVSPAALALMIGCCFWTLHYDTMYSCLDRKDDIKIGIKSTAVLFGPQVQNILRVFTSLTVVCLAVSGYLHGQGISFYVLGVGGASAHLLRQLARLDVDNTRSCLLTLRSNAFVLGPVIWLSLFIEYVLT